MKSRSGLIYVSFNKKEKRMRPSFIPWLFDSREAWDKAVSDPRYQYNMPFPQFMQLYQYYRNGTPIIANQINASPQPDSTLPTQSMTSVSSKQNESSAGQILDQSEIDALLSQMSGF
jgi:hypothetical protein